MTGPRHCVNPRCHGDDEPAVVLSASYLCGRCHSYFETDLAELPALYDELALVLVRSGGAGDKVAGSRNPGLSLDPRVVDCRNRIQGALAGWSQLVVDERGLNPPGWQRVEQLPAGFIGPPRLIWETSIELADLSAFLLRHADWLAHQPFADEVFAEVTGLRRRGRSLAYPSGRRRIVLADVPCPEVGCGGHLSAILGAADSLLPGALVCSENEDHRVPAAEWMTFRKRLRGRTA